MSCKIRASRKWLVGDFLFELFSVDVSFYSQVSDHFPIFSKVDFGAYRKENEPVNRRKIT